MRKPIGITIIDESKGLHRANHLKSILESIISGSIPFPFGKIDMFPLGRFQSPEKLGIYLVNCIRTPGNEKFKKDIDLIEKIKLNHPGAIAIPVTYPSFTDDYSGALSIIDHVLEIAPTNSKTPGGLSTEIINKKIIVDCFSKLVSEKKILDPIKVLVVGAGELGTSFAHLAALNAAQEKNYSGIFVYTKRGTELCNSDIKGTIVVGRNFIHPIGTKHPVKSQKEHIRSLEKAIDEEFDVVVFSDGAHRKNYQQFHSRNVDEFMKGLTAESMKYAIPGLYALSRGFKNKNQPLVVIMTNSPEPYIRFCVEDLGMNPYKTTSIVIDPRRADTIISEKVLELFKEKHEHVMRRLSHYEIGSHGRGIMYVEKSDPYKLDPISEQDFKKIKNSIEQLKEKYDNSGLEYVKNCRRLGRTPIEVPAAMARELAKLAHYSPKLDVTMHSPVLLGDKRAYFGGPVNINYTDGISVHSSLTRVPLNGDKILEEELEFQVEMARKCRRWMKTNLKS